MPQNSPPPHAKKEELETRRMEIHENDNAKAPGYNSEMQNGINMNGEVVEIRHALCDLSLHCHALELAM
jgi:hypothetical protein